MKNRKPIITLIIILGIIFVVGCIFFIKIISSNKPFIFNYKEEKKLVLDKEYDNNFDSININSKASSINVLEGREDKILLKIYGNKDYVNVNTSNILDIKIEQEDCHFFCLEKTISRIDIYLPSSFSKEINITNNYGDTKLENFDNIVSNIYNDCGDIIIGSIRDGKIENDYGDIKIGKVDSVDVKNDCGDIDIGEVNSIKAHNSYGDISIKKINNYLNIEDDCGDIELNNINLTKKSTIKNDYGDIDIGMTNDIYIDASVDLGDISINNNNHKSDIVLKIENDCGDIIVAN